MCFLLCFVFKDEILVSNVETIVLRQKNHIKREKNLTPVKIDHDVMYK